MVAWLRRGNQRLAVAYSLRTVTTGSYVWKNAASYAPRITLRDTRAILREFESHGLVRCLNPSATSCRLYAPTERAQRVFARLSPTPIAVETSLPPQCDPDAVSFVLRGKVRAAVFQILTNGCEYRAPANSATLIKRALRGRCPVTLNQVIRTIDELRRAGLIKPIASDDRLRRYGPSETGAVVAQWFNRPVQGLEQILERDDRSDDQLGEG